MKPVQTFTTDYLALTHTATPEQVLRFLEDFRLLQAPAVRSRPISLRVPEPLLAAFKQRCALEGIPYQVRIKELMRGWLEGTTPPAGSNP
ncbi:MAG: hypothetical protein DRR03_07720 [Gammaproteobacteria bacterium]|nr:MAG: hypothetical protein DRR03_07720 [Gammaproteobacteria bacterium]